MREDQLLSGFFLFLLNIWAVHGVGRDTCVLWNCYNGPPYGPPPMGPGMAALNYKAMCAAFCPLDSPLYGGSSGPPVWRPPLPPRGVLYRSSVRPPWFPMRPMRPPIPWPWWD